MEKKNNKQQPEAKKTVEINSTLSRFEVPPLQDILVIGKEAPIGVKAMEKAMELISKGNYTTILLEKDEIIEAIVVKNCLLRLVPKKVLIDFVNEEVKGGMCPHDMLKLRIEVVIKTKKNYYI